MLSKFFGLQDTWHGSSSKFTQFWALRSQIPNLYSQVYKPLFRSILPKSAHFSKSFGCLAASKQAMYRMLMVSRNQRFPFNYIFFREQLKCSREIVSLEWDISKNTVRGSSYLELLILKKKTSCTSDITFFLLLVHNQWYVFKTDRSSLEGLSLLKF